jgi:O-antigen ligase
MLAIVAVTVVAVKRRIGLVPSLVLAAGLFVGASALNFTGGREISAHAGSDRTALWSVGLQVFKSHPLFGVGFNNFGDYGGGLTAHNSVVVCAAELGIFGFYFWALFLFATVRDALALSSPAKAIEPAPRTLENPPILPLTTSKLEAIDEAEIHRLGRLMVLSLTGFLVTAWFLSRSFVMTFFLIGGLVEAIYEMALRQGMISPRLPLARALAYSGGLAIFLVLVMYILLRTVHFMG